MSACNSMYMDVLSHLKIIKKSFRDAMGLWIVDVKCVLALCFFKFLSSDALSLSLSRLKRRIHSRKGSRTDQHVETYNFLLIFHVINLQS